jgi:hypothetical protein
MTPSPKSAILDLLQSLRGRSLPVRALVEAGALLGLQENGVRVALARLVARSLVERDGPGRYRLAAGAQPISRRVGEWSSADQRARCAGTAAWVGALTQVATARHAAVTRAPRLPRLSRGSRRGCGSDPTTCAAASPQRDALHELGPRSVAVLRLSELDPKTDVRARRLWDGERVVAGQRQAREALERSAARLERLSREAAMVETFLVGGRAIREIALDPCLPDAIAPEAERRALVAAMREYDRAGRACWREFMRGHDAPHKSAPANLVGLHDRSPS